MSALIHFFPRLAKAELLHEPTDRLIGKTLERYGLWEQFGDIRQASREVAVWETGTQLGPDKNHSGVMLAAYTRQADGSMLTGQRHGYFPQLQTWRQVLDANETQLWIGVDNDAPPQPRDLARRRQYPGYQIELGDEREWLVPVIRRPDGSSELPSVMEIKHGTYSERIREQYQQIWEDTARVIEWFESGEYALRSKRPEALPMAVRALGLNYRFGLYEQSILGLIDMTNYLSVLLSAIDWPLVEALARQKKTQESAEPASTTTSTGPADESPTIAPAEAS